MSSPNESALAALHLRAQTLRNYSDVCNQQIRKAQDDRRRYLRELAKIQKEIDKHDS